MSGRMDLGVDATQEAPHVVYFANQLATQRVSEWVGGGKFVKKRNDC